MLMEATTATKTMTNRMRHKQFLPFGDLEQIGDLRAHVKILQAGVSASVWLKIRLLPCSEHSRKVP